MVFKTYWIQVLASLFLWCYTCDGQCFRKGNTEECISPSKKELNDFINSGCREDVALTIIDLPLLQYEPYPENRCLISSLSIKNSRILYIYNWLRTFEVSNIELSYNNLTELAAARMLRLSPSRLVMSHNQIEFLDGLDLEPFRNHMQYLDLSHNIIKHVPQYPYRFSSNLRSLNLSNNLLYEIGNMFRNFKELRVIDLSFNKLRTISAENFRYLRLKHLNLSYNEIYEIEYKPHPLYSEFNFFWLNYYYSEEATVDMSGNKMKNWNEIFRNYQMNNHLSTIIMNENNFENLEFLKNHTEDVSGYSLIFEKCGIKKLSAYNFKGFELTGLNLANNLIEFIPHLAFEGLLVNNLSLAHNKIESINSSSFSAIYNLKNLNLSSNPIKTISENFFANSSINVLDLSHCLLFKVPNFTSGNRLSEIYLSHNKIKAIEPNTFPILDILDLSHNEIDDIQEDLFSGKRVHKILNLSNNRLKILENIYSSSHISNDTVSSYDRLLPYVSLFDDNWQSLSITRNPLTSISPEAFANIRLRYLNLTINGKIKGRNFFNLSYLKELNFIDSHIELDKNSFDGIYNLEKLIFENSTITRIQPGAFEGLFSLLHLNLSSVLFEMDILKSKTFLGLKNLESLNLSNNNLEQLEDDVFIGLRNLVDLNLAHNKIQYLSFNSFKGLRSLNTLDLSYNVLDFYNDKIGVFSSLSELTHLNLAGNEINCIKVGVFSGLQNLKMLNLSSNHLRYIMNSAIISLKNLKILDINKNSFSASSILDFILNFEALNAVGIDGNNFDCSDLFQLLKNLNKYSIDYTSLSSSNFHSENIQGVNCQ